MAFVFYLLCRSIADGDTESVQLLSLMGSWARAPLAAPWQGVGVYPGRPKTLRPALHFTIIWPVDASNAHASSMYAGGKPHICYFPGFKSKAHLPAQNFVPRPVTIRTFHMTIHSM